MFFYIFIAYISVICILFHYQLLFCSSVWFNFVSGLEMVLLKLLSRVLVLNIFYFISVALFTPFACFVELVNGSTWDCKSYPLVLKIMVSISVFLYLYLLTFLVFFLILFCRHNSLVYQGWTMNTIRYQLSRTQCRKISQIPLLQALLIKLMDCEFNSYKPFLIHLVYCFCVRNGQHPISELQNKMLHDQAWRDAFQYILLSGVSINVDASSNVIIIITYTES